MTRGILDFQVAEKSSVGDLYFSLTCACLNLYNVLIKTFLVYFRKAKSSNCRSPNSSVLRFLHKIAKQRKIEKDTILRTFMKSPVTLVLNKRPTANEIESMLAVEHWDPCANLHLSRFGLIVYHSTES